MIEASNLYACMQSERSESSMKCCDQRSRFLGWLMFGRTADARIEKIFRKEGRYREPCRHSRSPRGDIDRASEVVLLIMIHMNRIGRRPPPPPPLVYEVLVLVLSKTHVRLSLQFDQPPPFVPRLVDLGLTAARTTYLRFGLTSIEDALK